MANTEVIWNNDPSLWCWRLFIFPYFFYRNCNLSITKSLWYLKLYLYSCLLRKPRVFEIQWCWFLIRPAIGSLFPKAPGSWAPNIMVGKTADVSLCAWQAKDIIEVKRLLESRTQPILINSNYYKGLMTPKQKKLRWTVIKEIVFF